MPVTFINRNPRNFNSTSALSAINAHHAHIRHDRRLKATKEAARKRNTHILSYVEESDTSSSTDPVVLFQHIGTLRDDPFWTLPIENRHDAFTGFDYHFQVTCPVALSLGDFTPVQHGILRLCMLETAMLCSAMIAFSLTMRSLSKGRTKHLARAALYHANDAIVGLRKALMDPATETSDTVLATIFGMALVYVRIIHCSSRTRI
jgi:hypothetical protein